MRWMSLFSLVCAVCVIQVPFTVRASDSLVRLGQGKETTSYNISFSESLTHQFSIEDKGKKDDEKFMSTALIAAGNSVPGMYSTLPEHKGAAVKSYSMEGMQETEKSPLLEVEVEVNDSKAFRGSEVKEIILKMWEATRHVGGMGFEEEEKVKVENQVLVQWRKLVRAEASRGEFERKLVKEEIEEASIPNPPNGLDFPPRLISHLPNHQMFEVPEKDGKVLLPLYTSRFVTIEDLTNLVTVRLTMGNRRENKRRRAVTKVIHSRKKIKHKQKQQQEQLNQWMGRTGQKRVIRGWH